MTPILTITLNPTVDFATHAPKVFPGRKLRCAAPQLHPGGGGINVARAIKQLGGQATALIAIGGPTGAQLLQFLAFEGVSTVAIQGPGDTRRSFSVTDDSTAEQYRFVTPGPDWETGDVDRALAGVDRAAQDGGLVVLSGSQPPGVAKDFPAILAQSIAKRKVRLIVDTSGPALKHLTEEHLSAVYALRMNVDEAEDLAGRALPEKQDTAGFAKHLVDAGVAAMVIIARGSEGNVLATADGGAYHATAPEIAVKSPIGAGDSFVAGFTLALSRDQDPAQCLRLGTAAACAAVASEATELCSLTDVQALLPECRVTDVQV